MKKVFKFIIPLVLISAGGWVVYKWTGAADVSVEAFSLIPSDAIYCVATTDPVKTWKTVSNSVTWNHLRKNAYFAQLTASANRLDSLIHENDVLLDLIGSRALLASAHMTSAKTYDFLFLVDLQNVSGIKFINEYVTTFTAQGMTVEKEKYNDEDVFIMHNSSDKKDLFLSFPGTYLVASYTKKITLSALDAYKNNTSMARETFMKAEEGLDNDGLMQLYVNYTMLPKLMNSYSSSSNEYVNHLAKTLYTSGLTVSLKEEIIKASGNTYVNDSVESYLKTLSISGKGPTDATTIAPQRTAFYLGFGFTSFHQFFANFETNIQQDVAEYKNYKENLKQIESYLHISIQERFIDWVGDEVALLELQSSGQGLDNEVVLILKADNIEKARKDLQYIEKMVRKRTPVKFKAVDHQGYAINYVSMKGLFKVLFGKFFARYDKPYYTIINNFVVFSNHPQTLESVIDDYLEKKTLSKSEDFQSFRDQFDNEGSLFVYLNTPILFNTMKKMADVPTRISMESNKDYIVCFRQMGFQLVPKPSRFKTLFAEQFVAEERPEVAEASMDPKQESSDSIKMEEPVTNDPKEEADPMQLPYMYPQNVNASSYTGYFPDSTVHFKVGLKNGFKNGSFSEYHKNGETKMTGSFQQDKRDGTWRLYNESGKLILKRNYKEDMVTKERVKN